MRDVIGVIREFLLFFSDFCNELSFENDLHNMQRWVLIAILSAIVIGENLLPIIVIAQNILDLSITDVAIAIHAIMAINNFYAYSVQTSELVSWHYGKKAQCPLSLVQFQKNLFVLFNASAESVNYSVFWKNLQKQFLQFDLQKNFVKHIENLPQHFLEKFIGDNLLITDIA